MFKKILVAEDSEGENVGVWSILQKLQADQVYYAQYCDEAWLKAKRAFSDGDPFELLICDLSFKADHRNEKIVSGQELIAALKKEQPHLKTIVFSVEDHPQTVRALWNSGLIEGYVCKDRKGLVELREAVVEIYKGNTYLSPQLAAVLRKKNLVSLKAYEVQLLSRLAGGFTQEEIEQQFRKEGISPSSKSSIEKRLKELKEEFSANTTVHLITILKDLKLI